MSKNINLKIARARKDMTQKELAEQAVPKNLLGTRLPIGRSVLGGERK